MIWRALGIVVGLLFVAIVVVDVHGIVATGGVLNWTLGLLHGVFFAILGLFILLVSIFASADSVRSLMVDFFRSVISRKNLREVGAWMLIIILVVGAAMLFTKLRA